MDWIKKLFAVDIPSPSDIVRKEGIVASGSGVFIDLGELNIPFTKPPEINAYWDIPDTNSMDAVFDFGHNNILIRGADAENQKIMLDFMKVGDIAVFRIPPNYNEPPKWYAIHRISKIGYDKEGRYFKFKGDHNPFGDPYVARDFNILWLYVGTIC